MKNILKNILTNILTNIMSIDIMKLTDIQNDIF